MVSKRDHIYYLQELRYLREQGKVFSQRHPDVARYLGISGSDATLRDPHAERIVEAFAFMSGKLHNFMDAQFPNFTQSLFGFIYPQYPRPLPARALVSFSVKESMIDKPVLIPRGTELYAPNLGPEGQRYAFTTCWDIWVQPLFLDKVYHDPEAPGDYSLSMGLRCHQGSNVTLCQWDHFEFCISADPTTAHELFWQFSQNLVSIGIKGIPQSRGKIELVFAGFQDDHDYCEDESEKHSGLHFPRDYFHDPKRFMTFQLRGIHEWLKGRDKETKLQLDFIFNRPMGTGIYPKTEYFSIHSCVAQNLYEAPCEPFNIDDIQLEYLLTQDASRPDLDLHSLVSVMISKDGISEEVRPYYQFSTDHLSKTQHAFYSLRREEDAGQGWLTYIRFIDTGHEGPGALAGYTLSAKGLFTNRQFAQKLKPGQIKEVSTEIPETIKVENVSLACNAAWPTLSGKGEWDFLAHLGLDYSELHQPDVLNTLLTLYCYARDDASMRRIRGIQDVRGNRDYLIRRGITIQGRRLEIDVDVNFFNGLGDIALFARVMASFLRAWCPINGFIRLVVRDMESKTSFEHLAWG